MSGARRILILLVGTLLIGAQVACSLSLGGEEKTDTPSDGGSGANPVTAPEVWIREPANGAQVPAEQPVYITVETGSATTHFTLNAGGRVVSSVALPGDSPGPAQAILRWTPAQAGSYNLEVIAYNETAISVPAELVLTVTGAVSASGADTSPVTGCTARVMVSQLNFRDGPSTGNAQLGRFSVGETSMVIGRNADASWYQVQRINGQQVWVINNPSWLQVDGQCSSLSVVG